MWDNILFFIAGFLLGAVVISIFANVKISTVEEKAKGQIAYLTAQLKEYIKQSYYKKCPNCGKNLLTKSAYKSHMRWKHKVK